MRFTKSSGALALTLAAGSLAENPSGWGDWSSSFTKGTAGSSSVAPYPTCSASTVTSISTTTVTAFASTTTVYRSTVYIGPGELPTVTVCNGKTLGGPSGPGGFPASTLASAVGGGHSSPAPAGPASGAPSGAASGPHTAGSSASSTASVGHASGVPSGPGGPGKATSVITATVSPTQAGGAGGSADGSGSTLSVSGSIIATGAEAFSWTVDVPTVTSSIAVPQYSGWNDWNGGSGSGSGSGSNTTGSSNSSGPAWGSASSNVTAPQPILSETSCNTASDRSKWCYGKSISTNTYTDDFTTGAICSYDFTITNTTLNFDGTEKLALAVNGQVPGPLIECNWGDIIRVKVTNAMQDNATTIHWHGITQKNTNDQDGVPGVVECGIAPGSSRTYTFRAASFGTSWYHSHLITQYGDGIRGPMVIHGPATANYDIDMGTVMVDDTFNLTAAQQNAIISHVGPTGTVNYLLNGHNTKPDLSAGQHTLWTVKPGKKHLFRFINSASQNMFSVHFDNHKMTVISSDFVPITPYETEWLNIGIGQRYEVIVNMDQPSAGYFLRAVTQTLCPSSCENTGLGQANGIILYEGASATLPTSTAGNVTIADFAKCNDEPLASLVPFVALGAGSSSAFEASASTLPMGQVAAVSSTDDGTVFRWFMNNGAIDVNYTQPTLQTLASTGNSNSSLISNHIVLRQKNQWVYFVMQNQFFAFHPIHLHGHDFSILGQGSSPWSPSLTSTLNFVNPPRRDTAMLAGSANPQSAAGYTVIGFQTDNPGAWLMHCHIVWHVDGGLALQWIERPDDIPASNYVSTQAWESECSAMGAYEAANPLHDHSTGESGLKKRTYFEQQLDARADVVRRSDTAEKRYIDSFVKRGLGDGFKPRHNGRS